MRGFYETSATDRREKHDLQQRTSGAALGHSSGGGDDETTSPASSLCVAHTCVWLAFGVSAVSIAAQPTSRPIRQSTAAITGGQSNRPALMGVSVRYPTMLDMTFPEFESAVKRTDIVLLPVGSIEEHSGHLPLNTDAINSTALLFHVQQYLRNARRRDDSWPAVEHRHHLRRRRRNETADPKYPGNLTVRESTFASLYLDVLQSLRANGVRRAFLWPGHGNRGHNEAYRRPSRRPTGRSTACTPTS